MAGPVSQPAPPPSGGRPGRAPKGWLVTAASLIVLAELTLMGALSYKAARLKWTNYRMNEAQEVLLKADKIREAWSELAEQGSALKDRLSRQIGSANELEREIENAAKAEGVRIELVESKVPGKTRVKARAILITGAGPEESVLKFLVDIDRIPAVIETDELKITGIGKGAASVRILLRHFELKKKKARELKEFVDELPGVKGFVTPPSVLRREGKLFMAPAQPEEEMLKDWPKITLSGFSADKALFFVGGEAITVGQGEKVTGDIVYSDKPSVNQATLKRLSDGIEIITTVGSSGFAFKDERHRTGQSEFMLTIQKRPSSDLLVSPGAQ